MEFRSKLHETLTYLKLTIFLPIAIFFLISVNYSIFISRKMHLMGQLAFFADDASLMCITDLRVDSNTLLRICSPSVRK